MLLVRGTVPVNPPPPAIASPYVGTWNLFSTVTVAGCGDSPSDVGKEQKQVIIVNNSGAFSLPDGPTGKINSNGTVIINVPADACPGGTITRYDAEGMASLSQAARYYEKWY